MIDPPGQANFVPPDASRRWHAFAACDAYQVSTVPTESDVRRTSGTPCAIAAGVRLDSFESSTPCGYIGSCPSSCRGFLVLVPERSGDRFDCRGRQLWLRTISRSERRR
jgi:hypothetical protein